MGRHDSVHGSFPRSPPKPADPSPPGMHTTAIPHHRGHCSFSRITPLAALANRGRHSRRIAPPCPMHHHPHYLNKPGDTPKCKGYALVTFRPNHTSRRRVPTNDQHLDVLPIVKEAHKHGLRVIPKAPWDALSEGYLVYKQSSWTKSRVQRLMKCIARTKVRPTTSAANPPPALTATHPKMQTQTTPSSPYPFECLVSVRNVHPGTNKTTLTSLFAQVFRDRDGSAHTHTTAGLDYVDFSMGMETVRVRPLPPTLYLRRTDCTLVPPSSRVAGPHDAVHRLL
jgi:hypothetical protein